MQEIFCKDTVADVHAQLNVLQPVKDALGCRLSRAIELSPPELLARGAPLSAATDVYTFGLLLVEIILGSPLVQKHQSDRDLAMVSSVDHYGTSLGG
jgi:hypothetical protein